MRSWSLFLLAVACHQPKGIALDDSAANGGETDTDTDADTDTDTDTDLPCTATVTGLLPAAGSVDLALDTPVVATFSEPVEAAGFEIVPVVSGTVTVAGDGLSATWAPTELLERSTDYVATARACDSSLETSFTTIGEATGVDLAGRTYDVDLAGRDITWRAPGSGSVLISQVETTHLLFMVESVGAELDLVGTAGVDAGSRVEQYECAEAIDFAPTGFASDPLFAVGPQDATISAGGYDATLFDLRVSGRFSTDGESLDGVRITALLDTAPLDEAIGLDVCDLLANFGDSCVACPDGVVDCLEFDVEDLDAPWLDGMSVDPAIDPSTNPDCG